MSSFRLSRAGYAPLMISVSFFAMSLSSLMPIIFPSQSAAPRSALAMASMGAIALATVAIQVRLAMRRLYDLGRPGWQAIGCFVPIFQVFWILYLMLAPGEMGDNLYGSDPRTDLRKLPLAPLAVVAVLGFIFITLWTNGRNSNEAATVAAKTLPKKPAIAALPVSSGPAVEAAKQALEAAPCDGDLQVALVDAQIEENDLKGAVASADLSLAKCGDNVVLQWRKFNAYKRLGEFDKALAEVDALIASYPSDKDYRGWRGLLFERLRRYEQAAVDYEKAIQLSPKLSGLPMNLAAAYLHMKHPCKALATLERYKKVYPNLGSDPGFQEQLKATGVTKASCKK